MRPTTLAACALTCVLTLLSLSPAQTKFKGALSYSPQSPVKPEGRTSIRAHLGKVMVLVTVVTTKVPIDIYSKAPPTFVQCTYSRRPCSLTNLIEISVNGKDLEVPQAAYASLGDIDTIAVAGTPSHLLLVISGGDAAGAYDARFQFDSQHLLDCIVYLGEADFPPPLYSIHFNYFNPFPDP